MDAADGNSPFDDFPEWQLENIEIAKQIISGGDKFISLPCRFDIHEYSIMEKFCYSVADESISDTLQNSMRGSGAFRRFKDTCQRFDIIDQWYTYKTEALNEIAIAWCRENNIEYEA